MKQIVDRAGRVRAMPDRFARILVKAGRSSYLRRDMEVEPHAPAAEQSDRVVVADAPVADAPRQKRRYKRRDQFAQE